MNEKERKIRVNDDGSIEIPVVVGGRLLYDYTIVSEEVKPELRRMWIAQLREKRWMTPSMMKDFEDAFDLAIGKSD